MGNRHELLELEILKHVEQSPRLNNRVAARKLGVSVKLAHIILKKMVSKGLLHVKKEHARRWDYFLTPSGISEKTRLTYEFLDFSMQFYREARRRSAWLCRTLAESGVKQIGFLGSGEMAEIVYLGVVEWGLELTDVFDDARANGTLLGRTIRPASNISDSRCEKIIVCLYDKTHPKTASYLPQGVSADRRFVWIFGAESESPSLLRGGRRKPK